MLESETLSIIGREHSLFTTDLGNYDQEISEKVTQGRFLVIGGAGSIGSAVVKQIFLRNPKVLHVLDISENSLAELVRDLRSSDGYIEGDFRTFCFDVLSPIFQAFMANSTQEIGGYDYVLNFSALKHVRAERDPFTLMRMIDVNVFATLTSYQAAIAHNAQKYFCVSTDKATNPTNMMGCSKRIMELFLGATTANTGVSTARFANVAFSDGSLPHGWRQRLIKRQPLVAPLGIERYFVTAKEGALLCLFSTLLGKDKEIFFPKPSDHLKLTSFKEVCERFLHANGLTPVACESEDEARSKVEELAIDGQWPCYYSASDTTGEKPFEEFYTDPDEVDWERLQEIGILRIPSSADSETLSAFSEEINRLKAKGSWSKEELLTTFSTLVPEFYHQERGKYLDAKM